MVRGATLLQVVAGLALCAATAYSAPVEWPVSAGGNGHLYDVVSTPGGISWTDQDILQVWYPPHGFHQAKGIILGSYQWDPKKGEAWGKLKPAARLAKAIAEGEKIHPGYGGMVEKGMSVAWNKVPYMFGCAPEWAPEARQQHYPTLVAAEGAHYMVGDQISFHGGWQEGAIRSAHRAIDDIAKRVAA